MSEAASTLLKAQFSEHEEVAPVVPGTDGAPGTADTGFYTTTTEDVATEAVAPSATTDQAIFVAFAGLAFFILIFVIIATIKKRGGSSLEKISTRLTKFQVLSAASASVFLAMVFNSAIFGDTPYIGPIDTNVSEELTIDADVIGTDNLAYVKDTITISASPYGYDLYISADDDNNQLIADSTGGAINSITEAGSLTDNTYGFSFENPETNPNAFQPIQIKDNGKTSVRHFTPEETTTELQVPIWYGVRSKNANEDVYRTNIEYQTIGEQKLDLEDITPEICASLEEDTLDYIFTFNGEDYKVSKLKDGNCWTKPVPTEDPEEEEPVLACPTNWHEAKSYNYDDLDLFYHVKDPETTANPIIVNYDQTVEHPEGSCIADFSEALVTYDPNGVDATNIPEDRHLPDDTTEIVDFEYTIEMPPTPSSDALCQSIIGWSRTSDGTSAIYEPAEMVTFSSPNVKLYAIWSHQKTPKAILDVGGTLNFVYDYCTVEDVNNPATGYKAAYEATHPAITEDGVYIVPENTRYPYPTDDQEPAPWLINLIGGEDSNPNIHYANFDKSFKDFQPKSTSGWFLNLMSLTSITNLENLNTSDVFNMSYMFSFASSLTSIFLPSGFGTSATNMQAMFLQCLSLASINSSGEYSFPDDFGSNAKNMRSMFNRTISLTEYSFPSGFGKDAEDMSRMFENNPRTSYLNFPSDFGAKVEKTTGMFAHSNVIIIKLPEGFGSKLEDTETMFAYDTDLQHIYVESPTDWNTSTIKNSVFMFGNNAASDSLPTHLPGFDISYANDITNAHIGMKDGVWGYFEDACNIDQTCQNQPSQGQSTPNASPSLLYAPSTSEDEPEEPTTTPEPTDQSPESNTGVGPSPLGASKASKDYSFTMILFIIAMVCLSSGTTLLILIIEKFKAEYREENDQF